MAAGDTETHLVYENITKVVINHFPLLTKSLHKQEYNKVTLRHSEIKSRVIFSTPLEMYGY